MALDAIATPTTVEEVPFKGRTFWTITGHEADASTAIEIQAAPGAGKSLYLLHVIITSTDADAQPQLQDEDDNVLFGRFFTSIGGVVIVRDFTRPLKLRTNKALELKAAAAGNVSVYVEGAIAEG